VKPESSGPLVVNVPGRKLVDVTTYIAQERQ